jgi:uncharacterized protein
MFKFLFRRKKPVKAGIISHPQPVTPEPTKGAPPMASEGYHVPLDKLSRKTILLHYAISSLREELEAVDWYRQRADDTEDAELKSILLHNAGEETEHAAMILEWIRRNDPRFDKELREYLFTEGPITEAEKKAMGRK